MNKKESSVFFDKIELKCKEIWAIMTHQSIAEADDEAEIYADILDVFSNKDKLDEKMLEKITFSAMDSFLFWTERLVKDSDKKTDMIVELVGVMKDMRERIVESFPEMEDLVRKAEEVV